MTTLGDVMVSRGGSVAPSTFPQEEFELYSIPAHDRGGPEVTLGCEIGSSKQLVQPSDVMVSKIIPHIRRARVVGPSQGRRQIASGEWIVFRGDAFDPNYLRHFLLSDDFHGQFMNTVAGVGGSLVRARPAQVKAIGLPLPSLAEQRRIAAILDHADALRAKRRQVLTHLDTLTQSIFHDMFGDHAGEMARLEEVAIVSSGITKGRRTSDPTELTPYLAVANVQAGYLKLDMVKEIPATAAEIQRYALRDGDLVLTEGGDPDKLGRGTVWRNQLPLCLHQNHIFRVRPDEHKVLPEYLSTCLAGANARDYFLRSAKQTTGIASINMTQLRAAPVSVPPITQQLRFLDRIAAVAAKLLTVQRAQAADDELFASLQSRAFRGEL
ncbi:MAG: hypothetical protein ACRCYX_13095 [Dermatophilaceae bacterium]